MLRGNPSSRTRRTPDDPGRLLTSVGRVDPRRREREDAQAEVRSDSLPIKGHRERAIVRESLSGTVRPEPRAAQGADGLDPVGRSQVAHGERAEPGEPNEQCGDEAVDAIAENLKR
jgi:hypothetical protein